MPKTKRSGGLKAFRSIETRIPAEDYARLEKNVKDAGLKSIAEFLRRLILSWIAPRSERVDHAVGRLGTAVAELMSTVRNDPALKQHPRLRPRLINLEKALLELLLAESGYECDLF